MKEVTIAGYHGINNRLDRDQIKGLPTRDDPLVDLSAAVNVDLDDAGKLTGRGGTLLVGAFPGVHSAFSANGLGYCVRLGVLYQFNPAGGFTPLANVGTDAEMSYWDAAKRVFFSNGVVIGEVVNGVAALYGLTTAPFKAPIPAGSVIAHHKARLYSAAGNVLWISDVKPLSRVDLRHGFKQFPDPIRMIAPGPEGVYVGTEKAIYYAPGGNPLKMPFLKVADCGAKKIPVIMRDASEVKGIQIEGVFPVFIADGGACMGLPQGQIVNLTEERYNMPPGVQGTLIARNVNGQVHYIIVYR